MGEEKFAVTGCKESKLNIFDRMVSTVEPHPFHATILLELHPGGTGLKEALYILDDLSAGENEVEVLHESGPKILQIRMPREQAREAVLRLTESGFTNLKAIDPRPAQQRRF